MKKETNENLSTQTGEINIQLERIYGLNKVTIAPFNRINHIGVIHYTYNEDKPELILVCKQQLLDPDKAFGLFNYLIGPFHFFSTFYIPTSIKYVAILDCGNAFTMLTKSEVATISKIATDWYKVSEEGQEVKDIYRKKLNSYLHELLKTQSSRLVQGEIKHEVVKKVEKKVVKKTTKKKTIKRRVSKGKKK